jgi:hypothetical protein
MKRYYVANWTTTLVSSLSLVFLALLPASVYGEIRLCLAIYVTLGTVFTLGIPFLLVKERKNLTKEAFQDILKVFLLLQLLLFVLGLCYLFFWGCATSFSTFNFLKNLIILICSFLYAVFSVVSSFYQSYSLHTQYLAVFSVEKISLFSTIFIGYFFLPPQVAVLSFLFSYLFSFILLRRLFKRFYKYLFPLSLSLSGLVDYLSLGLITSKFLLVGHKFKVTFSLTLISIVSANFEFLFSYVNGSPLSTLGEYSRGNLFYLFITALISPFVAKEVTKIGRKNLSVKSLILKQFLLFILCLALVVAFVFGLSCFRVLFPGAVNSNMLAFANLSLFKALCWSSLCLSGAVLYHLNFQRLIISVSLFQLFLLFTFCLFSPSITSLVISQSLGYLLSGLLLLGCLAFSAPKPIIRSV